MMPLATTPGHRHLAAWPLSHPAAPASPPPGSSEPSTVDWVYRAAIACAAAIRTPAGSRQSDIPIGTMYRTTLAMPGLGRVRMTVAHRTAHLAVRLSCATQGGYALLTMSKYRLELRLTRVLGQATQVEVAHDGTP
ncbi:hypothetical protein C0Z18_10820 [Trinickia dabaoshanensis]|uniref:Flagellar hook-length control protein FliK n=2 Tax=Trinickia dabaoshanensis TaxID=564714 RepID=A0A2N7VTE5_9BURK|nr:hypothetical protein C0Z18_10820 [Trinickia dabaoshanensis]